MLIGCTVSAVAGSDYAEVMSMTFTISSGSTDGDMSECLDVSITDDALVEGNETFTVQLVVTTAGVTTGNDMTTVTITDNEGIWNVDINV